MLEIAGHKAQELKLIDFIEGNATYLSHFADRSFDLVLNMDGPGTRIRAGLIAVAERIG
jgi:ubiquinone/menaquinone biosynthesis C-methylase UbiE